MNQKPPCAGNCAGSVSNTPRKSPPFVKVLDHQKRPIRGLWQRGDRYYGRLNVNGSDRRLPLEANSIKEARTALAKLQTAQADSTLRLPDRGPTVSDFAPEYLRHASLTKRPRTVELERLHLDHFARGHGHLRLDQIDKQRVLAYRAERLSANWSKRTCNLALTIIRNLLRHAVDTGALATLPLDHVQSLRHVPKRKRLYGQGEIKDICEAAIEVARNGRQVADYIRLMAYSGARRDETLRLRWSDVDWEQRQLVIGSDGLAKNHRARTVDFNSALESLLREMLPRRREGSDWLFASPIKPTERARTFKQAIWAARRAAGADDFAPHHCRVFFASQCVMAGIDFHTIAEWLGHQDGGLLLSRVYARLSDEHKRRAAARLAMG